MPLWTVDIEKQLGLEFWTNRYILNSADLASATAVGAQIVTAERTIHTTDVNFNRYRVADLDPLTDIFTITPIGLTGGVTKSTDYLPLFNVLRVDFGVEQGRPSRKYLRLPIQESQQVDFAFTPGFLAFVQTNYVDAMLGISQYVDVDGQNIINGAPKESVAMRQLRRGSKRRVTPPLG